MGAPAVSVLMPAWNAERWIREALDSILFQSFEDWELVAVDDGSTDGTAAILREYAGRDPRVRAYSLGFNAGVVQALNTGVWMCHAPLVARQDADDFSAPGRLGAQKEFMDLNPGVAVVGAWARVVGEDGEDKGAIAHPELSGPDVRRALKSCCALVHGSAMFRKAVVLQAGGYSGDLCFRHAEDFELWVRLAKSHELRNMPEFLYFHREHPARVSVVHKDYQDEAAAAIMRIARKTL